VTVTVDTVGGFVTVGGCAVTVTVLVTVDAIDDLLSSREPRFPRTPRSAKPPTTLPTMIKTRLLDCGFDDGGPHCRPFQYTCPDAPLGSGYQPGLGDGCVVKFHPWLSRDDARSTVPAPEDVDHQFSSLFAAMVTPRRQDRLRMTATCDLSRAQTVRNTASDYMTRPTDLTALPVSSRWGQHSLPHQTPRRADCESVGD
jgi:hypothetical protein